MSEVRQVVAHIKLPDRQCPTGQIAYGFYTVADGVVTMTDPKGEPATDNEGKTYVHKLAEGETAEVIAARLTKKLRLALMGKSDVPAGFRSPINYPSSKKLGIV